MEHEFPAQVAVRVMNPRIPALCVFAVCLASLSLAADPAKPVEGNVVKMAPYVVKGKSLAQSGFGFKATFRHHLIWAGIKELMIVNVEPRSAAKKAGLEVGEKILQIRDVKVDGLGIGELKREFERPSANGMIRLTIQAKDSAATRIVELQFSEPSARIPKASEPNQ